MLAESLEDEMTTTTADEIHGKTLPALITRLRCERQLLAERHAALAGCCDRLGIAELLPQLETHCQHLVDYVALGHFEVFQLMRECPGRGQPSCASTRALLEEIESGLADTAQAAVDFNDRYGGEHTCSFERLAADLARLGAVLAARTALEERLFAACAVTDHAD